MVEGCNEISGRSRQSRVKISDHWYRWLLRACCERPSRCTAEQRDELTALQSTELHPLPQTMERQDSGLASTKSGLAALRDFDAAFGRFAS
jgi:hypothetical protein